VGWEYSTRRYLKGFSVAIVLEPASAQDKIEAILNWMAHGPARLKVGADPSMPDRDPTDTLNYASLLQVCGSATNAFINLADSTGLPARRLLLLDSHQMTKHVVAEVRIDGRWIVVDPAFRVLLRGADGRLLTREELSDPAVFSAATRSIRDYDPVYTFDRAAHVRLARLGFVGLLVRCSNR
jgi:Transglutaminase-like superfamily